MVSKDSRGDVVGPRSKQLAADNIEWLEDGELIDELSGRSSAERVTMDGIGPHW